jgi:hypothetical protein
METRAVDRLFGYELLNPGVSLRELDAVSYGAAPLHEFCTSVLFEGPNDRLVVREFGSEGGWIAILPSDDVLGGGLRQALCIRVRWDDYRGLRGVRRLAERVYLALKEVDDQQTARFFECPTQEESPAPDLSRKRRDSDSRPSAQELLVERGR